VHQNMIMERLSAPVNAGTGHALRFTASFKQIRLITNERTTVRVLLPSGKKRVKRGQAFSKPVDAKAATAADAAALASSHGVLR
jgi:hypothetical protein